MTFKIYIVLEETILLLRKELREKAEELRMKDEELRMKNERIRMQDEEISLLRVSTSTLSNSQHEAINQLVPSISSGSKAADIQLSSIDSSYINPIVIASNDDNCLSADLQPLVIEGSHGSMASCCEFDKVEVEDVIITTVKKRKQGGPIIASRKSKKSNDFEPALPDLPVHAHQSVAAPPDPTLRAASRQRNISISSDESADLFQPDFVPPPLAQTAAAVTAVRPLSITVSSTPSVSVARPLVAKPAARKQAPKGTASTSRQAPSKSVFDDGASKGPSWREDVMSKIVHMSDGDVVSERFLISKVDFMTLLDDNISIRQGDLSEKVVQCYWSLMENAEAKRQLFYPEQLRELFYSGDYVEKREKLGIYKGVNVALCARLHVPIYLENASVRYMTLVLISVITCSCRFMF